MMLSSSSNSFTFHQENYDVFLSFRGEDTRTHFTSHLYAALCRKKIETFIDDEELQRGDEISPSLIDAIETSLVSVVVFSEDYASSRWCLDELEKVLECKKAYGQIVIPIFYHVDPSDVRKQTGSYGDAFAKHEERFRGRSDKLQKWRAALTQAANLSGWDSNVFRNESTLIEEIVKDILKRLNNISSSDKDNSLVGIDSRIHDIERLLSIGSMGVRGVGIWGIGGIGKTTLARALFNKISNRFESSYFIESIRETEERVGLYCLQQELFSAILEDETIYMGSLNQGDGLTKRRFGRKNVLIVLDDVTHVDQMKSLIFGLDWLGSRSRIIITSRDKQVLENCGVNEVYKASGLPYNDALKLFSQKAFRQNHPMVGYVELSDMVVKYIHGVPLALIVFGSFLYGRTKEEIESAIDKLKRIPHMDIMKVLKISYDGLDDEEKRILLDIACLLDHQRRQSVIDILNASGFSTEIGLCVLADKCLIDKETLKLHDLVRQMAREIVRQESIKNPGRRSRLWDHEDIYQVLTKKMGTEEIEGISLDMSRIKVIDLHPHAFANMHNLRFLNFYKSRNDQNNVHVSRGLDSIFTDLRYVRWDEYPLQSLQPNFRFENLIELHMPHSNVKELWLGVQQFPYLKCLDVHESKHLSMMPDLSHAQNLERLQLNGCTNLVEVHPSIQYLRKLVNLSLMSCRNLTSLPTLIQLESLRELFLHHCSNLKIISEIPCNIEYLMLRGTAIEEVPSSPHCLSRLKNLDLEDCSMLRCLPNSICECKSLRWLTISGCSKLERLPDNFGNLGLWALFANRMKSLEELPHDLGRLSSLEVLELNHGIFERLPTSITNLSSLRKLHIGYCERLQCLPNLPPELQYLYADECKSLEVISGLSCLFREKSMKGPHFNVILMEEYQTMVFSNCFKLDAETLEDIVKQALLRTRSKRPQMRDASMGYPGSKIPEWFMFQSRGSFISFELQPGWYNKNFIGFALCVVLAWDDKVTNQFYVQCRFKLKSNEGKWISHFLGDVATLRGQITPHNGSNHVLLGYDLKHYDRYCNAKEISVEFSVRNARYGDGTCFESCQVKKCGIHLLYTEGAEEPKR